MMGALRTRHQGGSSNRLSEDDGFDLLSNHRRRYALHYMQQNGQQATLGELAEWVAAWENEVDLAEISAAERKRAYTALQQVHLPQMDEMGVVDFDERAGTVELDPAADDLDIYLEIVRGRDVPWSLMYVSLAIINLGLLAAVGLDTPPLAALPDIGWGVFSTTTFLVAGACHYLVNQREMLLGTEGPPPEVDT